MKLTYMCGFCSTKASKQKYNFLFIEKLFYLKNIYFSFFFFMLQFDFCFFYYLLTNSLTKIKGVTVKNAIFARYTFWVLHKENENIYTHNYSCYYTEYKYNVMSSQAAFLSAEGR